MSEGNNPKIPPDMIAIVLKGVGDAPIVKPSKWVLSKDSRISGVIEFLKGVLKLKSEDSLFLYVSQAFSPSQDQLLSNLYECFGFNNRLVIHYAITPAYG